jgi:excisionase family DNA binding protein
VNATWDDEYLTVIEIAAHLKLNPQTVRNYIDQGRLPAVRIGRRVRVRRADVDRMLAEGRDHFGRRAGACGGRPGRGA